MKYELVIFDFDGTLADSYPWFLTVFDGLAQRYRLPRMDDIGIDNLRSLDIRQIQKKYRIPLWKMLLIGNQLKKMMSGQIENISLFNGMQSVIQTLGKRGVRLALVTSNAEKNVRRVLGPDNLAFFEYLESGISMYGKKKTFHKIIKKTGIPAHQALSIGDEVRDLKSAHAAKIAFGAVSWGYTDIKTLQTHAPDEVFTHPGQIIAAVSGSAEDIG